MGLTTQQILTSIENGTTSLGIEFGSTRIKAVLTAEDNSPIASGSHDWENRLEDGIWTYTLEDIWSGLQDSYAKMAEDVSKIRSCFEKDRSHWVQCHDAWLYGI